MKQKEIIDDKSSSIVESVIEHSADDIKSDIVSATLSHSEIQNNDVEMEETGYPIEQELTTSTFEEPVVDNVENVKQNSVDSDVADVAQEKIPEHEVSDSAYGSQFINETVVSNEENLNRVSVQEYSTSNISTMPPIDDILESSNELENIAVENTEQQISPNEEPIVASESESQKELEKIPETENLESLPSDPVSNNDVLQNGLSNYETLPIEENSEQVFESNINSDETPAAQEQSTEAEAISYQNLDNMNYSFVVQPEASTIQPTNSSAYAQLIPVKLNNQNVFLQLLPEQHIPNAFVPIESQEQPAMSTQQIVQTSEQLHEINIPSLKLNGIVYDEIKISIVDYIMKLQDSKTEFLVRSEKCPLTGSTIHEDELHLSFKGAETTYLIPPDHFHDRTKVDIAFIIHNTDPANYGKVVKIKLSEEKYSGKFGFVFFIFFMFLY